MNNLEKVQWITGPDFNCLLSLEQPTPEGWVYQPKVSIIKFDPITGDNFGMFSYLVNENIIPSDIERIVETINRDIEAAHSEVSTH